MRRDTTTTSLRGLHGSLQALNTKEIKQASTILVHVLLRKSIQQGKAKIIVGRPPRPPVSVLAPQAGVQGRPGGIDLPQCRFSKMSHLF